MTEVLRTVARLHLGAQDLLHDLGARVMLADAVQKVIEGRGLDHLAESELDVEGGEIILERDQLLAARRFVDAIHHGGLLGLERLGRGDVGGDHVILDQPVRVEPFARHNRADPPLLVEYDSALGQVELERLALLARGEECSPARP